MKKTKRTEKLSLSTATLRKLSNQQLAPVGGGVTTHATICNCQASVDGCYITRPTGGCQ